MSGHTLGPWFVAEGGVCAEMCPADGGNVICLEPERMMAASLAKWPDNAPLLAAAPDLLEAAEDSIDILDVVIDLWNATYPDEPDEVFTELQHRFRAAIAKARRTTDGEEG